MSGIKTIFGAASVGSSKAFQDTKALEEVFKALKSSEITTVDTAQIYGDSPGNSEELLGAAKAGSQFIIDSKHGGGFLKGGNREEVVKRAKATIERLGVDKLDIFYIHAPDDSVPIAETLAGMNDVYKLGLYTRFGLSNYKAEDVEMIHAHCKEHSYVLPTVYQGNYSPVARRQETVLFPTLRKLNMSFYAYSPLAGGFLTKTKQQVLDGAGRFGKNSMYGNMYSKPSFLEALAEWEEAAKEAGCSKADLAYRWVKYNSPLSESHGDAIIVGASSLEQLKQTLQGVQAGPLDEKTVAKIDDVWKKIEHEAPLDNFHG